MPDAISVRRTSGLPTASFRFHLTMNTLAFSYVLGATPCTQDSHLLERAHAEHTVKDLSPYKGKRSFFAHGEKYTNLLLP